MTILALRRPLTVAAAVSALVAGLTVGVPLATSAATPVSAVIDDVRCLDNVMVTSDDGSTTAALPFEVDFFGTTYDSASVNINGNVTFGAALSSFTPMALDTADRVIVAPYFGDVDTSDGGQISYGEVAYEGHQAFCVLWKDVPYYGRSASSTVSNTFQLLLVRREDVAVGAFDIVFNYEKVQWETGNASSGAGGLGGSSARVGYSDGKPANTYELPGSAVNGALLDSNSTTGLVHGSHGSDVLGRYVYQVRAGRPPGIDPPPAAPAPVWEPVMDRVVGADRYATAAQLSARSFRRGVERAFVASGEDFPDALGAAAVAGGVRAPVLLTRSGSIPEVVRAELVRLLPREIVVVGGSGAVSDGVVDRLSGFTGGRVVRAGGTDRFATSVALSRLMFPRGAERVFVATGSDFPDALSGAVAAGTRRAPVLVVPAGAVPEVVMQELVRLAPRSITVLGGTGVVSDEVVERLAQVAPVQRWAGADRYATSAVVSSMDPRVIGRVLVATGTGFADALAGAVVAAAGDATLVLSQQGCVPAPVLSELQRLRPAQVTLLGGPGALGASVESLTPCGAAG